MSIFTLCLRSLFIGTFLLVAQAALATIEVIGTTPTSLNDCDGTITIIAVGSAGPFKVVALGSVYHVQENVDGEYTIPDLCAGAYTIKVFNRFGCEKTINATIEKITCPTITLEDIEDAITHPTTCGGSDGEIYFRFGGPTGGTEPYSWLWGNGSTNSRLSFVTSGTYTLTITDAVGCTGVFDFTLTGQDEPEIVFEDIAPACEGDNNGQIVVFASQEGGGAVNFQWSAGDVIFQDNVSSRVGNLPPGTHTVTITNTNMNCSIVRNYEVTDISASIPLSVNAIKSNTCPENASGSIQLQITGGVPNPDFVENNNPYNVVWAHGVVSNTQLNNLSAGNYCVTVTDFCGAMVSQCFDLIVDPNKIFDVILTSSQNATGTDLNDGEITVEATPGNTGDFTYQWSNGATGQTISNLSVGNYSVTVTNNLTGCSIIRSYEVKNCEEAEGFEFVILGGSALNANEDIEFEVQVKQGNGVYSGVLPAGYTIKWTTPNDTEILGYGSTLSLNNNFSYPFVNITISNGCTEISDFKPILRCDTDNNLDQIFIVKKNIPCVGFTDGSVTIAIPNPNGEAISASLEEITLPTYPQGNSVVVEVGSLAGNNPYNLTISIGECTYDFSFELEEKETGKVFHHVDKDAGICYYSQSCSDIHFGDNYFQEKAEVRWDEAGRGLFGLVQKCSAPMYCRDRGVGNKDFSTRWVYAKEYEYILRNAGLDEYWISLSDRLGDDHACRKVLYCRGDLTLIAHVPVAPRVQGFLGPAPDRVTFDEPLEIIPGDDGCTLVRCPKLLFVGNNTYLACEHNDRDEGFEGSRPPAVDICNSRSGNVKELYLMYNALKSVLPQLENTGLGEFLDDYGNEDWARCATVTYCSKDLSYIGDNRAYVSCNTTVYSCNNPSVPVGETCTPSAILDENGYTLGYRVICSGSGCSPEIKIINNCEPPGEGIQIDLAIVWEDIQHLFGGISQEAKDAAVAVANFNDKAAKGIKKFFKKLINGNRVICPDFIISEGDQEELFPKVVLDTFQNEVLKNFAVAKYGESPIPRGVVSNDSDIIYYKYDDLEDQIQKSIISNIEHGIEDWDYDHFIYVKEITAGKESQLIFEDTTVAWINHISADTLFDIKHLSSVGYDIVLGGTFSGALQYDSVTVATSDSLSAFLFRIGYGGELENFHIIENIAPGSQVAFSENRNKAIAIAGKHLGNVEVNNIPIASNEGFFVVLIDSADQVQLLGDLQGVTNLDVMDVSYSPDSSDAHVALALRGTGALTLNGQTVVNTGTEELTIISLDSINHYNWNIAVPTDSINADKFDMTYGPDNSLFVGMTLNTQIPALPNGGGQDISLLKIDAQGATVWNKLYGTTEDETVSKLLYDHEILYFGGEFTGSVGDKTIGKYVFSNIVPANTKAYISYVIDGEEEQGATERLDNNQLVEQATAQGIEFGDKIEVYPNPFNNKLYIKVTGQKVGRIEIANYLGQMVYRVETGDLNNLEVDFNKNGNGFYFVKVFGENGTLMGTEKVVKQK